MESEMVRFVKVEGADHDDGDIMWVALAHVVKVMVIGGDYGLWLVGEDVSESPAHWTKDAETMLLWMEHDDG
jgi:hypothetical protein